MKKSKKLIELEYKLHLSLCDIEKLIEESVLEVKKDYELKFNKEKNKLLKKIATGENIDLEYLQKKYLKNTEIVSTNKIIIKNVEETDILERVEVNGNIFYYEHKENGKVYDTSSKEVGIFKNNQISIDI
jgi:hypothetical protein